MYSVCLHCIVYTALSTDAICCCAPCFEPSLIFSKGAKLKLSLSFSLQLRALLSRGEHKHVLSTSKGRILLCFVSLASKQELACAYIHWICCVDIFLSWSGVCASILWDKDLSINSSHRKWPQEPGAGCGSGSGKGGSRGKVLMRNWLPPWLATRA